MQNKETKLKFLDLWLKPIDGANPCGMDASFEESFEKIKEEVDKDSSLHAGVSTNWKDVLELVNNFLSDTSKDLWIAAYGVKAVYECHGLSACVSSLNTFYEVISRYWNELYPTIERLNRRCAPFQWIALRLENILQDVSFPADKNKTANDFREVILNFQAFLDDKFKENSITFSNVLKKIPSMPERQPDKVEDKINPIPSETLAQVKLPPSSSVVVHDSSSDSQRGIIPLNALPQTFRNLQEQALRLALHFLQMNMTDWRIYMLHRAALWCTITQLPQADNEGVTSLRPIPRDRMLTYSAAVETKRYAEILPQLEQSAARQAFWFDGHYMVSICLEGLKATKASFFLQASLLQLITMFPELLGYKYHDGTPFASPKTSQWLSSLKTNLIFGEANAPQVQIKSSGQDDVEAKLCEAIAIFKDSGFENGLKSLGYVHASRSRASICHSLLKARYCMSTDRPEVAAVILIELYEKLERWQLLEWEPELSAEILSLLISVSDSQRINISESMSRQLYWLHLDMALNTFKDI